MKKFCAMGLLLMMLSLAACDQGVYTKGVQGAGMGAAGGAIVGQIIGRNHQGTLIERQSVACLVILSAMKWISTTENA